MLESESDSYVRESASSGRRSVSGRGKELGGTSSAVSHAAHDGSTSHDGS